MSDKTKNIIVWVLSIAMAAFMALASSGKLAALKGFFANGELSGGAIEQFENWGYGALFSVLIGALELLGGIGLLIKPLRQAAALGLIGIMIGAAYTHIAHDEISSIGGSVGVTVVCLLIIFLSRK